MPQRLPVARSGCGSFRRNASLTENNGICSTYSLTLQNSIGCLTFCVDVWAACYAALVCPLNIVACWKAGKAWKAMGHAISTIVVTVVSHHAGNMQRATMQVLVGIMMNYDEL